MAQIVAERHGHCNKLGYGIKILFPY